MDKKRYEKPVNKKYALVRLFKYLMRHWTLVMLALFLAISANLLALVGPKLSGDAIDLIEYGAENGGHYGNYVPEAIGTGWSLLNM